MNRDNSPTETIAIIIPAYKASFLAQTLDSLVSQTSQDFHVYIGDDCSPGNLESIVTAYYSKLKITYKRFEQNLGGTDLVGHWNRCLQLMEDEEWFIMFSDDDLMEPTCIEDLLVVFSRCKSDVLHFNLRIIDADSNVTRTPKLFPKHLSSMEFFDRLYSGKIDARMPEFVFRRSSFVKCGGFVVFPDAMRSDNATVMQCASERGITSIEDSYVRWRISGYNVSHGDGSKAKQELHFDALVQFFNWVDIFCDRNGLKYQNREYMLTYLFNYGYNIRQIIGLSGLFAILKRYGRYPRGKEFYISAFKIIWRKMKRRLVG